MVGSAGHAPTPPVGGQITQSTTPKSLKILNELGEQEFELGGTRNFAPSDPNVSEKIRAMFSKTTGYTMYAPVKLGDYSKSAVIDTAAQASVMSETLYNSLELQSNSITPTTIRTVENGSSIECFKVSGVVIRLNGVEYCHDFVVGNFTDDIILGLDFLLRFNCVIDIYKGTLKIDNDVVDCWIKKNGSKDGYYVSRVVCNCTCTIPAHTRVAVPVSLSGPHGTLFVTCPTQTDSLLVPSVLLQVGNISFVEVINDSGMSVQLGAGDVISSATEAEFLEDTDHADAIRGISKASPEPEPKNGLPEHLKNLFEDAASRLSAEESSILASTLLNFADVFSTDKNDLGKFSLIQHKIETFDEAPTKEKLRRTPLKFQKEEEKTLNDMLEVGVIQPSVSEWAAAPVLVRKKSGEVRYTVDFRKLNSKTRKDAYPLPLISECTDMLSGSMWFHTLDLNSGYWQIQIDPQDRHKTAFLTKFGLFEHVRMAQGLCNAPATFQRVMNLVLRGLTWNSALVYLDDVIVFGKDFKSSLHNLEEVLLRMRTHNLKLKPKKCTLFGTEVIFLGRHVSQDGVSVTDDHVKSVLNWPKPQDGREASKFLGFINYHREFIPGLAGIAKPLYELTKPKSDFTWTEECEQAFQELKQTITTTPVLAFPNATDTFVLDTDASDFSIGAALYQLQEGQAKPIAFSSLLLTPEQKRYCTTRKELLAIVMFTRQFRHYLLGQKFIVRTDHSSLAWLFRFKEPTGQLGRWLEELSQYHLTIQHRSGVRHSNADGLSRIPCDIAMCNCYQAGKSLESLPCGGCTYCT